MLLDPTALMLLPMRLYASMPNEVHRHSLIKQAYESNKGTLTKQNYIDLTERTDGYTFSELFNIIRCAIYGPLRIYAEVEHSQLKDHQVRVMGLVDIMEAITKIKPMVSTNALDALDQWMTKYGTSLTD